MTHCPKCGGKSWRGPQFVAEAPTGKEALAYECEMCGWTDYRPTLDQQFSAEELVRRIAEQEQGERKKRNHTS